MENRGFSIIEQEYQKSQAVPATRTFMAQVFLWMTFAMVITSVTAYLFASDTSLMSSLRNFQTGGLTMLGWVVTLAPLGFVLLMSLGYQRLSPAVMTLLFITFSVLMGMSLSFILYIYTGPSVFKTFAVAAGMFGIMAVMGYTTKTDLTRFGSIMIMGVIGLMIAMLVNYFLNSAPLDYIISVLGVLIFTGLTAYDVQKLKRIGAGLGPEMQGVSMRKLGIMGALTLYLDFINLFLFLLRFMGDRR